MPQEEAAYIVWRFFFRGEKRIAKFLLEVAMEIKIGAARVDQHFAGVVIEKERHVHALGGNLYPLATFAAAFPLPCHGAVVVASALGNGRHYGVRTRS